MARKPIILTNAFRRPRGTYSRKGVSVCDKTYVYACIEEIVNVITDNLNATPLITPVTPYEDGLSQVLDHVDGILLPGAFSNIHQSFYGGNDDEMQFPDCDRNHDKSDIFIIKEAVRRNIPILGICRGMQAMNVALGGTLTMIDHRNKEENFRQGSLLPQFINHDASCSVDGVSTEERYMHEIRISQNSLLSGILSDMPRYSVNTMHEQMVDNLGTGLAVEALATDGVVEAISLPENRFFLGVQWHPEAQPNEEISRGIFTAFKEAITKNY